jgi:hypothetical protein
VYNNSLHAYHTRVWPSAPHRTPLQPTAAYKLKREESPTSSAICPERKQSVPVSRFVRHSTNKYGPRAKRWTVRALRAVHAAQNMAPGAGQGIVAHPRGLRSSIRPERSAVRSSIRCRSTARNDLVPAAAAGAAAAAAVLNALGGLRAAAPHTSGRRVRLGRHFVRFCGVTTQAASCDPGGAELPGSEHLRLPRKAGATWQDTCCKARASCQTRPVGRTPHQANSLKRLQHPGEDGAARRDTLSSPSQLLDQTRRRHGSAGIPEPSPGNRVRRQAGAGAPVDVSCRLFGSSIPAGVQMSRPQVGTVHPWHAGRCRQGQALLSESSSRLRSSRSPRSQQARCQGVRDQAPQSTSPCQRPARGPADSSHRARVQLGRLSFKRMRRRSWRCWEQPATGESGAAPPLRRSRSRRTAAGP